MEESKENQCRNCGKPTSPSDKDPCPHCGFIPCLTISVSEDFDAREAIKIRRKRDGEKKFLSETIVGADFFRDEQAWVQKERSIDREHNSYKELIVNPKTGKEIRKVDEPLTSHQNRGSAKYKPKK